MWKKCFDTVIISDLHGAVLYEDAVCRIRHYNPAIVDNGGAAVADEDAISCIGLNRSAVGSSINEKTVGRGIVPLVG